MHRKKITGFLLAVWLVLLGSECFEHTLNYTSPSAPKPLTLGDILKLAEPPMETIKVADAAKTKALGVVSRRTMNFCSSSLPGISVRRVVEGRLLLGKPSRIYKLYRVFLI